jgi:hypothetical protein
MRNSSTTTPPIEASVQFILAGSIIRLRWPTSGIRSRLATVARIDFPEKLAV